MSERDLDGVLFMADPSLKQISEFKKVFSRSVNLSQVDSKRWKLVLKKDTNKIYYLKLYFDGEIIDAWGVVNFKHVKITLDDLKELNIRAEKLFTEEWVYGAKDIEGLEDLINRVDNEFFGLSPYPTIIDKATFYWYTIATKQMFYNGNKRTALLTALIFLSFNGYMFETNDVEQMYDVSLRVANHKMSQKQLKEYILINTRIDFDWMSKKWKAISQN